MVKWNFSKHLKQLAHDLSEDVRRIFYRAQLDFSKHGLSQSQVYPGGNHISESLVNYLQSNFTFAHEFRKLDVASIGTCFAEEFARHLKRNNSKANYLYEETNIWDASANWGRVYTVKNLRQIIEYSFDSDFKIYIEKNKNGYFDPLRDYAVGYKADESILTQDIFRHREASKKIFLSAELLVITLGQNESWLDERGFVWGSAPSRDIRQQLDVKPIEFSYEENLQDLRWVIQKIKEQNPNINFLITVSPVPAGATFIGQNAIVQSMAGKSVLRAIVHQVVKECSNVKYFPSYELCLCNNKKTFRSDNRHVKFGKVREIFHLLDRTLFSGK